MQQVTTLKSFEDKVYNVSDQQYNETFEMEVANIMDVTSFPPESKPYFQSDDDVKQNKHLYLLHMRRGTTYRVVLDTDNGIMPMTGIEKWNDLLNPHANLLITHLAKSELKDIKIQMINWSPVEDPRITFNFLMSFVDEIKVDKILGVHLNTENYLSLLDGVTRYTNFLLSLDLESLSVA